MLPLHLGDDAADDARADPRIFGQFGDDVAQEWIANVAALPLHPGYGQTHPLRKVKQESRPLFVVKLDCFAKSVIARAFARPVGSTDDLGSWRASRTCAQQ
jgi:hypothetical protein